LQGKEKHCERKFGGIFVDCDGKCIGRPSGSFPANGTRNPRFRPNASRRGPTSLDICLGNSPPPASDRFTGWSNARQIKAGCILLPGAALLLHIAGGQPQIHGIIDQPVNLSEAGGGEFPKQMSREVGPRCEALGRNRGFRVPFAGKLPDGLPIRFPSQSTKIPPNFLSQCFSFPCKSSPKAL
jgi:hypothetical protein